MRLFLATGFLLLSVSANAALIDNGIYTTDTNQDIQWLDLTETVGLSVADALATNAGWRLATNAEVEGMFAQAFPNYAANRVGFDFAQYTTDPFVDDGVYTAPPYAELIPEAQNFQSLFGATEHPSWGSDYTYTWGYYQDESDTWRTTGVIKNLLNYDTWTVFGLDYSIDYSSGAENGNSSFGTYLVRSTTVAPIPAAIDVQPNDANNFVKTDGSFSDKMFVTIQGSAEFDATQVDSATVKFGPAAVSPHIIPGVINDRNQDGYNDMDLRFRIADTGLGCDLVDEAVTLTGETNGGLNQFEGSDVVTTSECVATSCHP